MIMKRASTFLLALLLSLSTLWGQSTQIELISEQADETLVRISIGDIELKNVQTPQGEAVIVSVDEGTPILEKGAPDLPKLTSSVIIPWDGKMKVEVVGSSSKIFENIEVAPSKGNLYRNVDPATIPFEYGEVYEQDAFYPQEVASLRTPYVFRDFRGQTIVVNPVQYNPVTKELRVLEEVTVKVSAENETNADRTAATGRVNAPFDHIYDRHFLNYDNLSSVEYDPVSDWGNMLIVAHDDYVDMMKPYMRWKQERGIPTEMVAMSDVGSSNDDLLDYVTNYYNDRGLTYLLLVGDEYTIPTIMVNYGGDYSCDNCYSYMEGNDHYPEFFVGRFNAEDEDQVQTMIDRSLMYETNPDMGKVDWFDTALGLASNEGAGIGDDDEADWEHQNNIKIQLLDYTYTSVYEFYDGSQGGSSPTPGDATADASGNANASMINDQIEDSGAGLMNYTGHGWEQGVASGSYDVIAVNDMEYNGSYPFFIVVACCTGDFTDNAGGDCLGEAWIRATDDVTGEPTGGIGGLFASIYQSWAPPMEGQDEMINIITEAVPFETRHMLGGIAINGMASMNDAYGGGGDEMTDTWNFFGDPSIVLWTATPEVMTVDHAPTTPMGSDELTVSCDVEGAMISVFQDSVFLGMGIIDNGEVVIQFDEPVVSVEDLKVTATAHNYMPYQGPVLVLVSGPYVTMEGYNVDDSAGNSDGEVDFAESILLDVELENIGLDVALGVEATLSIDDPMITITDDTHVYGDIEASTTANATSGYAFEVADGIEDQYEAKFKLMVTDANSNSFELPLNVVISAPKLEVGEIVIDDFAEGNGNGRLDVGEKVTITIQNINVGHSDSPLADGLLETDNTYLTILNASYAVGTILEEGQATVDAVYEVQVADEVPYNEEADFEYAVEAGAYGADANFSTTINLLVADFEESIFDERFDWNDEVDKPWFITDQKALEGLYSSQSGTITHNEVSEMIMTINVLDKGDMSFHYAVSSEQGYDELFFYIDGEEMGNWSGEIDWTEVVYPLEEGIHELKWAYEKDQIFSQGEDAAWVDFVTLPNVEILDVNSTISPVESGSFGLFPNPVSQQATVSFELVQQANISVRVVNQLGQTVGVLAQGEMASGNYQFNWNAAELPAGIYFVEFRSGEEVMVEKVVKQ
jgi:hypothetical protein